MIKKIILILASLFLHFNCLNSQKITHTEIIPARSDTGTCTEIITEVCFTFGVPGTCPVLSGYIVELSDSSIQVRLYYDISGVWSQFGCCTADTINANILNNRNYTLFLDINTINDSDTIEKADIDTLHLNALNVDSRDLTDDRTGLIVYPNLFSEFITLFPSERYNFDYLSVEILTINGYKVYNNTFHYPDARIQIDMQNLPGGLYIIKCFNDKLLNISKILKL